MGSISTIKLPDNTSYDLKDSRVNLKSSTKSTYDSNDITNQNGRQYAVVPDKTSGYLSVNVPWVDTTYSDATTSASGLMSSSDKTALNGVTSFSSLSSLTGDEYVVFVDGATTKKVALSTLLEYVLGQAANKFIETYHPTTSSSED